MKEFKGCQPVKMIVLVVSMVHFLDDILLELVRLRVEASRLFHLCPLLLQAFLGQVEAANQRSILLAHLAQAPHLAYEGLD